jgi:hypothetical protein
MPEDGVVGMPGPAHHVEQGDSHRDGDPLEHAQSGHGQEGDDRNDEVGAAHPPEGTEGLEVEHAQRRRHDDRCEGGRRQGFEHTGRPEEKDDDGECTHHASQLGPRASRFGNRGSRRTAADGEAAQHPRSEVGGAKTE